MSPDVDVGEAMGRARSTLGLSAARWESGYQAAVVCADLIIIVLVLRVGLVFTDGGLRFPAHIPGGFAAITGLVLLVTMVAWRVWERRILGQGADEMRKLGNAVGTTVVALGLAALAADVGHVRPWVFGVLPATGIALAVMRYALRRVLHAHRRAGRCMLPVLAAGSDDEVAELIDRTRQEPHQGWMVVAVCVPLDGDHGQPSEVHGVPVVGGLSDVPDLVRRGGYRVIAVTPDSYWTRLRLRELAWNLEDTSAEMVVAPVLMEVTGPRLHVAPVYGLTVLRVSKPTFSGGRWLLKSLIDRVSAFLALLLLGPVLLVIALAIKLEDRWARDVQAAPRRQGRPPVLGAQVPFDDAGCRAAQGVAGDPQRGCGSALQDAFRSPGHPGRSIPPALFLGRVAAVTQCPHRADVDRRPAAAAACGGRSLRCGCAEALVGEAGGDRTVAGERTQRTQLGGDRSPPPTLR